MTAKARAREHTVMADGSRLPFSVSDIMAVAERADGRRWVLTYSAEVWVRAAGARYELASYVGPDAGGARVIFTAKARARGLALLDGAQAFRYREAAGGWMEEALDA